MNELLKSLVCAGTECACWILVLFNIFAVFYLVFCSFWKISRLTKIYGWVYSGILICATIAILFFHTCIYTLLATIFTGMMLMAILSIILPQQGEFSGGSKDASAKNQNGAYVISETSDGWFVFGIYDSKRRHLINSTYAYDSIEKAKEEINACRESGAIAETEDRSGNWIQEKYIPKFVLIKNGEEYEFYLRILDKESIIRSKSFKNLNSCTAHLEKVKANIDSPDVYMSMDKVSPEGYQKWAPLAEEVVEGESEEFVTKEPQNEENLASEPVNEEAQTAEAIIEETVETMTEESAAEATELSENS